MQNNYFPRFKDDIVSSREFQIIFSCLFDNKKKLVSVKRSIKMYSKNSKRQGSFVTVVAAALFLSTVSFSSLRQHNSCYGFTSLLLVSPSIMKKSSSSLFLPPKTSIKSKSRKCGSVSPTMLQMGLDIVTYLRCEWISASLCTNQSK